MTALFFPPFLAYSSTYFIISCASCTAASKNDPKAIVPKWLQKHLQTDLETALVTFLSPSFFVSLGEKYQIQAALAMINWLQAPMKALIHRYPNKNTQFS
jgi:hypothetical protein